MNIILIIWTFRWDINYLGLISFLFYFFNVVLHCFFKILCKFICSRGFWLCLDSCVYKWGIFWFGCDATIKMFCVICFMCLWKVIVVDANMIAHDILQSCPTKYCYSELHITLECKDTKLWPIFGCIVISLLMLGGFLYLVVKNLQF